MQKQLSIIIPFYNEEKNIPIVIASLSEMLLVHPFIELVLVNNGSTDNSAAVFTAILENREKADFKLISIPVNKGYGNGILNGLRAAVAPVLSWTHADLQTDPKDIIKAYDLYKNANDVNLLVKGRRRKRNLPDRFFTWGMQAFCYFKLGVGLSDINAQPKLFSRSFFEKIQNSAPQDFSLDLYFLFMAKKTGSIQCVDVFFTKRLYESAKGGGTLKGKWNLIKRTITYVNQLSQIVKK